MYKLDLEKAEEPEIKLPISAGSLKKQRNSRKTYTSAPLAMLKPLIVWITTNSGKFLRRWEYQISLTCLLRNLYADQESNRYNQIWNELVQNWKRSMSRPYIVTCLFNLCAEYILRNTKLDETQAGIKAARRNINNLRYANDTTLMAESQEELKSLLMKVKEESENVGLKPNIQKMKIRPSGPITSWQVDGWKNGNSDKFYFLGLQNHWRQWLQPRN